ncbi:MAG: glutamyl-tRNA reductase [Oscillospiraceae bacterium]|nr:glutamyl-tRNA reductase [Oscillospiraceae bacterium]
MILNIVMSGIDHTVADVSRRERFALSQDDQRGLFRSAKENPDILGLIVLSTCNRTELYLSLRDGVKLDPFTVAFPGESAGEYRTLSGREAFWHLAALACGIQSRIYGEDQILTQVKHAVAFAREQRGTDNILEVFFRAAISAAKRIRTEFRLQTGDASAAAAALAILNRHSGGRRILVIGNGEVGRRTAQTLTEAGYRVTMTLRQYRHGAVSIPARVSAVEYDSRYEVLEQFDGVVSATASPHCTISAQRLMQCPRIPSIYIDLAMPRDIEPEVGLLPCVTLYDIDQVADGAAREQSRRDTLERIEPFIERGYEELMKWELGRARSLEREQKTHFPLFIDSTGKTVLVVGGGAIAARRVASLSRFSFDIHVVAPEAKEEILRLAERGRVLFEQRPFEEADLEDAFMAVAATDSREVNHRVAVLARHKGIYASIADRRDECSFYFPAIAENDKVTAGICGDGVAHQNVAAAAKKIREVLNEAIEDRQP